MYYMSYLRCVPFATLTGLRVVSYALSGVD